jgi:hypothetical protein
MKKKVGRIYLAPFPFPDMVICVKSEAAPSIYYKDDVGAFEAVLPSKDQLSQGWQIPWNRLTALDEVEPYDQRTWIKRVFN